ncbi:hypothetical protein BGX38DRAFT_1281197 [Terfezia claveryi]|nr:hypothetical protein BGX38DRAFT_1281197 [Terfezia claveryi]
MNYRMKKFTVNGGANLDFDARVPIPPSVLRSAWTTKSTHNEEHIKDQHIEPDALHHEQEHREDHLLSSHSHDSFAREDAQSVAHSVAHSAHSGTHLSHPPPPVEVVHIEENHKHFHIDGHDIKERIKEKISSHLPHLPGHSHHGNNHHQGNNHHLALVHTKSHHKESEFRPYTGSSKSSESSTSSTSSSSSSSSDSSKSTIKPHGVKRLLPSVHLHKHNNNNNNHHHHQDNTHKHTTVVDQVAQPLVHSITHTKIEEHYTVDKPQVALTPYSEPHTPEHSYTVDPPTFVPVPKKTTHETHEYKDIHIKHNPNSS